MTPLGYTCMEKENAILIVELLCDIGRGARRMKV